jgi:hypothetical protein
MKILDFHKYFPEESSYKEAFIKYSEQEGVICKKWGNHTHLWKKNCSQLEHKKFKHRTTIKSGTVVTKENKLKHKYK